jgi:ABC-type glutathione transport system ATPase component
MGGDLHIIIPQASRRPNLEPTVRIHFPPAENPQTIGSSAAEPIAPRSESSWRDLTTTLISAGSHLEDWFCLAGEVTVTLVKDAILAVHQGEFVAITGASGSAKSPLLYLLLCAASFDELVRLGKQQWRHGETESPAAGSGISPPSTAQASLTTYKLDTLGVY